MNPVVQAYDKLDHPSAATGESPKKPADFNAKFVNHQVQKHVGAEVLECAADTGSKTVNEASAGVAQAATRLVKSSDAGNETADRAAVGWSVVHRQNASPNKRNPPVHQVNTPKEVSTSNSFGVLVSEPVMDDTGKRV